MGMISAEAADKVRNQPCAQRKPEGQRHRSGLWLDELIHGRERVVELKQHRIHVAFESRTCLGHPQRSAGSAQQRRADLDLQTGQARDTPDWVTLSSSLTSVTVITSATCGNPRTASVST